MARAMESTGFFDQSSFETDGLTISSLLSSDSSSSPIKLNEFLLQWLFDQEEDPALIEELIIKLIEKDSDFSTTTTMLNLAYKKVSSEVYRQLESLYSGKTVNEVEFLFSLNMDKFMTGLQDQKLIRHKFMDSMQVGGQFIQVPSFHLILKSWYDKQMAGHKRKLEEHFILERYPVWFIALTKAMNYAHSNSLIKSVHEQIQDSLYNIKLQATLLNFLQMRVLSGFAGSPSCLGRSRKPTKLFNKNFLVVVASVHVPLDMLMELCEMLGGSEVLGDKAIKQLAHLNSL